MTRMQMTPSHRLLLYLLIVSAALLPSSAKAAGVPRPRTPDLEELLGQPLPVPIKKVVWATAEPQRTNLLLYEVLPPKCDESRLKALAQTFGVQGKIKPTPAHMDTAGFWIKETNQTNSGLWRSVVWSKLGMLAYYSGDSGHRWDLKQHKPLVEGVPTHQEAIEKALALLPVLELTTDDLERNSDGSIRRQFAKDTTGYNERSSKERKEVVNKRTVIFFQRVPNGETLSVGEGGVLQIGFVSEGKVADIELLFRDLKPVGTAKPLSSKEIVSALQRGRGRTFRQFIPETLTVTNCAVVYPQGNSSYQQKYVWPAYAVTGFGDAGEGTNTFSVFVPSTW
jgi:hypothetical protein